MNASDTPPVEAYLGLRFARHVERFAPAEPAESGPSALVCTEVPIFPQLPGRLDAAMGEALRLNPQSEDAYFLNVWAPRGADGLPVLVFIHGGAWTTGGGSASWYDGTTLARSGLVVVTLNYRLGALAHLVPDDTTDPTPLALGDLMHALRWVKRNIGAFGGDPARVTLAGQSTGAWYAHVLNLTPAAAGLFDAVALWSMPTRRPWPREKLADLSALTRSRAGTDLRRAPIPTLLAAGAEALREQSFPFGTPGSAYLPTESPALPVDLYDAARAGWRMHASRLWVRATRDETAAFFFAAPEREIDADRITRILADTPAEDRAPSLPANPARDPYRALVAQTSWAYFERFPLDLGVAARVAGRDVHITRFEVVSSLPGFLSGHTLDLPYQFGNPTNWPDSPMLAGEDPAHFETVSSGIRQDTYRFAAQQPAA